MKETAAAESGRAPPALPHFDFATLVEINAPALSAITEVNAKLADGLLAINREWMAFMSRRFEEDAAMPQHLACCKSAHEMYGVYADFFQRAYIHYQSELEHLTRLGRNLTGDTVHMMQDRFEKAAHDLAERSS